MHPEFYATSTLYKVTHKKKNASVLPRARNQSVLETISLDHCTCWRLEHCL